MKLRPLWKTIRECTTYATVPTVFTVLALVVAAYADLISHPSMLTSGSTAENMASVFIGPIGGALYFSIPIVIVLVAIVFPALVLLRVFSGDHWAVVIVLGLLVGAVVSVHGNALIIVGGALLGAVSAAVSWLIVRREQRLTPHSKADAP